MKQCIVLMDESLWKIIKHFRIYNTNSFIQHGKSKKEIDLRNVELWGYHDKGDIVDHIFYKERSESK